MMHCGLNQDAYFSLGSIEQEKRITYDVQHKGNRLYVFLIDGEIEIDGDKLAKRDAMGLEGIDNVQIKTNKDSELLLIEVPMN